MSFLKFIVTAFAAAAAYFLMAYVFDGRGVALGDFAASGALLKALFVGLVAAVLIAVVDKYRASSR